MSSGRRRSSRLIASPWVHNWPKKPPAFVTIDDDGESCRTPGIVSGGTLLRKKVRGSVFGKSHGEGSTSTRMEIRSPSLEANRMMMRDQLEDDDAFVTPREQFSNSGRKETEQSGRKMGSYVLPRKARGQMASSGNKQQSQGTTHRHDAAAVAKQKKSKVGSLTPKISETRKRAVKAISTRAHLAVRATTPKRDQANQRRSYEGYIQKKFSPRILADVMRNLSEAQAQWVKSAGFGSLLGFRMEIYTHRLAYRIADAFCSRTCELRLKAGTVVVTESLVNKILGLPQGPLDIELQEGKVGKTTWDEQYRSTSISPGKVRDKLKSSKSVDYNFKMNFLILVYNFFIEANQNMYISRRLLSFGGNIDECGRYNWCKLLIDKLRTTHEFWSEGKAWRNFAGPLAFLIFCYVTCLETPNLVRPSLTYPTYLCWTKTMLRERQNRESSEDTFGVGSIVILDDELEAADKSPIPQGMDSVADQTNFERASSDNVVPDSISGDSEEVIDAGCEGMDVEQDRNGCPLDELLAEADLMQEANAIEIEHTQQALTESRNTNHIVEGSAAHYGRTEEEIMMTEKAAIPTARESAGPVVQKSKQMVRDEADVHL
ncbi:uncharacterized protein LOC135148373 isoform X2 [Daucus carota subsp. sativus]|uniref:uncharacterized protein LOC135148373 isoform X2 n=1 Tax=Daucus carota subsp. sativus TaxID=79200 RepID=UPI00308297A6